MAAGSFLYLYQGRPCPLVQILSSGRTWQVDKIGHLSSRLENASASPVSLQMNLTFFVWLVKSAPVGKDSLYCVERNQRRGESSKSPFVALLAAKRACVGSPGVQEDTLRLQERRCRNRGGHKPQHIHPIWEITWVKPRVLLPHKSKEILGGGGGRPRKKGGV